MTDADRAKAAELARARWDDYEGLREHRDAIAAALAEARAPYDRLTADLRALAEELLADDNREGDNGGWRDGSRATERDIAARLRAVVEGAKA